MKNFLILNGNSDPEKKGIDESVIRIKEQLISSGYSAQVVNLREMVMGDCTGCFGCWIKTPGICIHKDDMPDVLRHIINSDAQIMVTDVTFGMVSNTLISAINRYLPLACAYMHIDEHNKTAHHSRYKMNWNPALVVEDFEGRDEQSIKDISYCIRTEDERNYLGTFVLGENEGDLYNAINNN